MTEAFPDSAALAKALDEELDRIFAGFKGKISEWPAEHRAIIWNALSEKALAYAEDCRNEPS